jgi:hypothetical protein
MDQLVERSRRIFERALRAILREYLREISGDN